MGEHADDGDGEDEEPSVPPSDDSPADRDPDRTNEAEPATTDADDGTADEDAVDGTADEDAVDGTADEDAVDDSRKAESFEPAEPPPSAEEWLEDNPEHDSADSPPDSDAPSSADDAADGDEPADEDDGADGEGDADGSASDDDPNRIEEGETLDASAGGSDDEPLSVREARARAAADSPGSADDDAASDDGDESSDDEAAATAEGDADDETVDEDAVHQSSAPSSSSGGDEPSDGTPADDEASDDSEAATDDESADEAEDDSPTVSSVTTSTTDPGSNAPAGISDPAAASGGGGGGGSGGYPGFDDEMAPDDEEQPLTEHIEEMTHRLLYVVLLMGVVAALALLWSDDMINFLWYSFLNPGDGSCPGPACPVEWRPHLYHPLSLLLARLKMAALVGFVAGLPVAVYQTYRFMRPGLYPHERRYYLAAVPTSLVLALFGVAFAYFVILPSLFLYFSAYSSQAGELAFALSDTFNLMVLMLGFFALVFQIPLLVMLAIMMGVTTRRWLEERRLYFWTGFAGVAFIFSPDPTGMAPLLVAITMVALFEGTLLLLRWTERSVALFSARTLATYRPYAWALAAFVGYVVSSLPVPEGYFDALPPILVETLAAYGYVGFTPAIIAGAIVLAFEALGWVARRVAAGQGRRTGLRVRLTFIRLRPVVWLLAIVVGYMGSPDPIVLDVFRDVSLGAPIAAGVAVGLIVAYEALRLVLARVRPE